MTEPTSIAQLQAELVSTQELVTHLQQQFEELNSVVLTQQSAIDELRREILRLESALEQSLTAEPPRSLEDERPPHY